MSPWEAENPERGMTEMSPWDTENPERGIGTGIILAIVKKIPVKILDCRFSSFFFGNRVTVEVSPRGAMGYRGTI